MKNNEKQTNEKPKDPAQVESLREAELVGRFWVIPEETPGVALLQAILGHTRQANGITCVPTI